jgi:hypothetical protein
MHLQDERTLLLKLQSLKLRRMEVCDQIRQLDEARVARCGPRNVRLTRPPRPRTPPLVKVRQPASGSPGRSRFAFWPKAL